MNNRHLPLALSMLAFSIMMLLAYFGLVTYFDFPNILRQQSTTMLQTFNESQNKIIFFYYLFVLSQIILIGVVLQLKSFLSNIDSMLLTVSTGFGVLAGFAQAIGFLRWPFVTPFFSSVISNPDLSIAQKESALIVFEAFHRFSGVAVGENLFFVLESVWILTLGLFLLKQRLLSITMSSIPIVSGILILVYSLEQFGGIFTVLAPLNVIAHGAIVFWFIALAKMLLQYGTFGASLSVGRLSSALIISTYLSIVVPSLFS